MGAKESGELLSRGFFLWSVLAWLLGLVLGLGLGAGFLASTIDHEVASHERLVVKDFYGAFGFLNVEHFEESIALGSVRVTVVDNLDVPYGAHTLEEVFEIVLGGIVGEVTDVESLGFHREVTLGAWCGGCWF